MSTDPASKLGSADIQLSDGLNQPSESVSRRVVNGLGDPAVLVDGQLRIVHYNAGFALLTGLRKRELEQRLSDGCLLLELVCSEEPAFEGAVRTCIQQQQDIRLEGLRVQPISGPLRSIVATFIPVAMSSTENAERLLLILRDVSAQDELQRRFNDMLAEARVRADVLEREVDSRTRALRLSLEQVTRLSHIDPLTDVLNRRAFTEMAQRDLEHAERYGRVLAVILCDLDHFKRLNDTFGHQAGDAVLKASAEALSSAIRRTDRVARFGGEEFVLLLNETSEDRVLEVARRCLDGIREIPLTTMLNAVARPQTVSAGVALFPKHGGTLDELIQSADRALYHSKASGRDQVSVFDASMVKSSSTSPELPRMLLVGDDTVSLDKIAASLANHFQTFLASHFAQALDIAVYEQVDGVVVAPDFNEERGMELLGSVLIVHPLALRVLLTPEGYAPHPTEPLGDTPATVDVMLPSSEVEQRLSPVLERELAVQAMRRAGRPHRLKERKAPTSMVVGLDKLIAENAVSVVYQPVFEIESRRVHAYEALTRVNDAAFSNPEFLFDGAVMSGRIWRLSRLARSRAVQPVAKLQPNQSLFMNFHPAEIEDPLLLGDGALLPWAKRIVLELTERASLPDVDRFRGKMRDLRSVGYRFAIDDLGAGYASLNLVAMLEPDYVKIDKATVQALAHQPRLRTLVRRIVQFANDAGIQIVGEGVECQVELDLLAEAGCHLAQGYFLARPAARFPDWDTTEGAGAAGAPIRVS